MLNKETAKTKVELSARSRRDALRIMGTGLIALTSAFLPQEILAYALESDNPDQKKIKFIPYADQKVIKSVSEPVIEEEQNKAQTYLSELQATANRTNNPFLTSSFEEIVTWLNQPSDHSTDRAVLKPGMRMASDPSNKPDPSETLVVSYALEGASTPEDPRLFHVFFVNNAVTEAPLNNPKRSSYALYGAVYRWELMKRYMSIVDAIPPSEYNPSLALHRYRDPTQRIEPTADSLYLVTGEYKSSRSKFEEWGLDGSALFEELAAHHPSSPAMWLNTVNRVAFKSAVQINTA